MDGDLTPGIKSLGEQAITVGKKLKEDPSLEDLIDYAMICRVFTESLETYIRIQQMRNKIEEG